MTPWLVGGLGLAGVACFGLASWRGRWSLWVAGYLLIVAAVVVALGAGLGAERRAALTAEPDVGWNLQPDRGFSFVSGGHATEEP